MKTEREGEKIIGWVVSLEEGHEDEGGKKMFFPHVGLQRNGDEGEPIASQRGKVAGPLFTLRLEQ